MAANKIYISYSHRDRRLADELVKSLKGFQNVDDFEVFYDQSIQAGQDWNAELARNLKEASIVLFLLSPEALKSNWIIEEMQTALTTGKHTIPVLLAPCDWQSSPVSRFQVLPRNTKPIMAWKTRKEALAHVVEEIRAVLKARPTVPEQHQLIGHKAKINRIAVTPDGTRGVSVSDDCTAIVWDLVTAQPVGVLKGHEGPVLDVAISPDSTFAATGSQDTTICLWNLKSLSHMNRSQAYDKPVIGVTFVAQAVVGAIANELFLAGDVQSDPHQPIASSPWARGMLPFEIKDLVGSHDEKLIISAYKDGVCRVLDATNGFFQGDLTVAERPLNQLSPLRDGVNYVSCSEDGSIQLFNLQGTVRRFQISTEPISGIAPLPDARHAVALCGDGMLRLCDLTTGNVLRELATGNDPPTAVAVTPDGKRAFWGSRNGAVSFWPLETAVQQPLPEGPDRLKLAYLAVLELPELWRVLETFDEAALAGVRTQLALPPETDLLQFLMGRHPNAEPPKLWSAWMETLHESKLRSVSKPPVRQ